jgi:hypothetical protein
MRKRPAGQGGAQGHYMRGNTRIPSYSPAPVQSTVLLTALLCDRATAKLDDAALAGLAGCSPDFVTGFRTAMAVTGCGPQHGGAS